MNKISFKSGELNVVRRAESRTLTQQNSAQANPFGISFKGRILTSDVFESSKAAEKVSFQAKVLNKGKLYSSAVVGSLVTAKNLISEKFTQVIGFVKEIHGKVSDILSREVISKESISNIMSKFRINNKEVSKVENQKVEELLKKPVAELRDMLTNYTAQLAN